jgi:general secretion pathway protein I
MGPGAPREAGFTLLEVLVSFVIAGVMLAVLFQMFSRGLSSFGQADGYARAVLLAQSRLESLGVAEPLVAGTTSGSFDRSYAWRLAVEPADAAAPGAVVTPFNVRVTVAWREGGAERTVSLASLRLAAVAKGEP